MTATSTSPTALPGPRPMPILGWRGNVLLFGLDPVAFMHRLNQTYGNIVALARGHTDYVFVFGPEYNQQVLSNPDVFHASDADNGPIRLTEGTALARIFSNGLNQMNGPRHKQQRRLMMPALHKKRIEAYRDDIVALTERRLAGWRPGQSVDILKEMRQLTLSIAVKTLLGLDPNLEGETTRRTVERWQNLFFAIPTILLPFNIPGLPYRRLLALTERLAGEFQAMIDRKRAAGIDEGDALSMLMQAQDEDGARLTDDELIGQAGTLFVAGHETTASALTWTLFLLSQHPRVLTDLLDEINGALRGEAPRVERLGELPLLERVIKESMRLLPPFIWQLRISSVPFDLGPYHLPPKTTVALSSIITHRIPDLYPQPNKFLPERWLGIDPSPYEYLPFSAGPRMCLGAAFAMLEIKLVLPIILQRYRLTLPPKTRVDRSGLVLSAPKGGLPMRIAAQDRQFTKSEVRGNIRSWVDLD